MSVPARQVIPVRQPLRLRLKPAGSVGGYVDGGWWPRSRDLTTELPALAHVLAVRLGSVRRVVFALAAWDAAPRRIELDGHSVRLEGFRSPDENSISVVAVDRERVRLLVIPPDADRTAGHNAMMTAAGRDNFDTPATILIANGIGSGPRIPLPREPGHDAQDRWEADGGRIDIHD